MSFPFNKQLVAALAISITLHAAVFVLFVYGRMVQKEGGATAHSIKLTLQAPISSTAAVVKAEAHSAAIAAEADPAPVLKSALPEGDYYFLYYEVDQRSDFVEATPLVNLEKIISSSFEVKIKARVLINESGRVDSVAVLEAEPSSRYNEATIAALLQSRFSAAEKNGKKVKSQKILEIKFEANRFEAPKDK